MATLPDTLDHKMAQEPLVPQRRAAWHESEARAEDEARVHALIEEVSHLGIECQDEMNTIRNSLKVRKENSMGRAIGLWLLGVPVFVIILLYLFHVI